MTRNILKIAGMHSLSSSFLIETELKKLPGVKFVNLNFASEKLSIDYDPKVIHIDDIVLKIEQLGFSSTDVTSESGEAWIKVLGISSPHSAIILEKSLKHQTGIKSAKISFVHGKVFVTYNPEKTTLDLIKKKITASGYEVCDNSEESESLARKSQLKTLRTHLVIGSILSILIVLGTYNWFLLPNFISNPFFILILATPIQFWIGLGFYKSAWTGLKNKSINVESLVVLGTTSAFIFSLVSTYLGHFSYLYYDVCAATITFLVLGRYLEIYAKEKSLDSTKKLTKLPPLFATLIKDSKEFEVPVTDLKPGNVILVKKGQRIPIDGEIIDGESNIDESMLTGEMPLHKKEGSKVYASSINLQADIKIKCTSAFNDNLIRQLITLVEEAQSSKAPFHEIVDKIASFFVPSVVFIAIICGLFWYSLGATLTFSLLIGMTILIIACPAAIGLATSTPISIGTGKASEYNIIIKSAQALETAHKTNIVVFDKTGTITKGKPEVTNIIAKTGFQRTIIKYAAIVEQRSTHPIAKAIVEAVTSKEELPKCENFKSFAGKGVTAEYKKKKIAVGNRKLFQNIPARIENSLAQLEAEGKTTLIVSLDEEILGIIAISDPIRDHVKETIQHLKKLKIKTALLTGDNQRTAHKLANELGFDEVFAEILPSEKEMVISKLKEKGKIVAVVGNATIDAPALAQADLGIAFGTGTDLAIESANIILMKDEIKDVLTAIQLSKYSVKKIKQNLFIAFSYNIGGIIIASGALYSFTGSLLNPAIAGIIMANTSLSIFGNSLLMKFYKPKIA